MSAASDTPEPSVASAAAKLLAQLTPGVQELALFEQLARLVVLSTVEVSLFRAATGEILLVRRPADDPWWPGLWHVPGTVLLASDTDGSSFDAPVRRMIAAECNGAVTLLHSAVCHGARPRRGVRGSELTAFCWAEVTGTPGRVLPDHAAFVTPADALAMAASGQLVPGHDRTIGEALAAHPQR